MTEKLDYDKIVKDVCNDVKRLPLSEESKKEIYKLKTALEANPQCKQIIEEQGAMINLINKTSIPRNERSEALKYYKTIQNTKDERSK